MFYNMLCNLFVLAISTGEDNVSWVVAGDQAIFSISGVDIAKIR